MAPLVYRLVRLLFKLSANAFYAIEVEGLENIPPDGCPTILCPNHSNSLTDPVCLLSSIPSKKRDLVRMTAKDTFWRGNDLFSLLIRGVGTVPIKRSKDYNYAKVDNSESLERLIEQGNCICMFPEGISRYNSQVAPFKPGVAHREDFSINLLTVSIVYTHREKFRSNVLVKFNSPIVLTPKHQSLLKIETENGKRISSEQAIRELTSAMEELVRSNTLDAPNWQTLRIAHTARKLYSGHLGTRISLAEYVRLTKDFINALDKAKVKIESNSESDNSENDSNDDSTGNLNDIENAEEKDIIVERIDSGDLLQVYNEEKEKEKVENIDINLLARDLTVYQDLLDSIGIKDYRFSYPKPLSTLNLTGRIFFRIIGTIILATLAFPGWILWAPVFIAGKYKEYQIRKLPLEDNFDEITQYKIIIALIFLIPIYIFFLFMTFPFIMVTSWLMPLIMWLTIRWTEDFFQAFRSCLSLTKLLFLPEEEYDKIKSVREDIRKRVQILAVNELGLPDNPEKLITKSRPRGMGYFSIKRRRKKDYNEVLRLWDVSSYD
ncbi:9489_t:CDS:2 [Diversispora eburnea]|uniref:9489_t:CDS:1 n=1 Tax=Diversispora eburnea TaxID=1213867 RepID=A0A9N8V3S3_9GLOM|nr:9489_t:CDS:2 [Diversispora eburnea]